MHLLTFLQMLLINIHILDTPIVSFHKYDNRSAARILSSTYKSVKSVETFSKIFGHKRVLCEN